jgi:hypothetical protein
MKREIDGFLEKYPPDIQQLVNKTRLLIAAVMPGMVEQVDIPANLICYGTDRTNKGMICGIVIYPGYINLMLATGATLPDPDGLLVGTGKRARHVKIVSPEDVDAPGVRALIDAALKAR